MSHDGDSAHRSTKYRRRKKLAEALDEICNNSSDSSLSGCASPSKRKDVHSSTESSPAHSSSASPIHFAEVQDGVAEVASPIASLDSSDNSQHSPEPGSPPNPLPPLREIAPELEEFEGEVYHEAEDGEQDPEEPVDEEDGDFNLLDNEEDDEEQRENQQGLPGHDPPLYTGAPITLGQSLMAVLTFSIVHNITGVALVDLLNLIAVHCLVRDNRCIKTLHLFKKYFKTMESPLKLHYFCSNCFSALHSKNDRCQDQHCPYDSGVSYFIEVSVIHQLRSMFKRTGFLQKLSHRFQRQKKNKYEDIYDGTVYEASVQDGFLSNPLNISFTWNTDGVSIFKSTKLSIWPLYFAVNELPYSMRFKKQNVVIAGLWFGLKKPALPLFLNAFHSDLSQLYAGIDFAVPGNEEYVRVRGKILCGTCDMPAKAHFLNMIQYNGFYGCSNCYTRGERSERTSDQHAFPYENAPLRTGEETARYATLAENYNTCIYGLLGHSALRLYVADYITTTCIDIMHCVYEGVTKKLLHFWFEPEFSGQNFSLRGASATVSDMLKLLTPPSFIKRMPRSITDHLAYWKASEFKNWLFYYSVPVLSTVMSPEYLNHHMLLVHGIYLLNLDSISDQMIDEADLCLNQYVSKFSALYDLKYLSINFHMLLHLAANVRKFGPLWATSCMPYEDLNGQLKRLVHGTTHAALQITASLSQVVNLPIMLAKLHPDDEIRKWCENVLSRSKVIINEIVSHDIGTVGRYVKFLNVPPLIHEALVGANIVGNVSQFFRLRKGKLLYFSQCYERYTKTSSTAVRFKTNNEPAFGLVYSFARVSDCECIQVCHCEAQFFAIIFVLQTERPFTITHPHVSVSHVMRYTVHNIVAVPVQNLETLCFHVNVNDCTYLMEPVNTLEDE